MFSKFVKDYFSFSKKERVAVIILVLLIVIIFSIPYLLPAKKESFDEAGFVKFRQEARQLQVQKEADDKLNYEREPALSAVPGEPRRNPGSNEGGDALIPKLFYFDPNTLSVESWKKLGLPERNIRTIQNYLSKGGKFRNSEDIEKIYGLRKEDIIRLKPFVRIHSVNSEPSARKHGQQEGYEQRSSFATVKTPPSLVDLNLSDTSLLISLPGIGSKLAARIINFREKLGGFYTVQQLAEVYGLPDSTFQMLQNRVTVSNTNVRRINVNTAKPEDLQAHPYLRGTTARLIFDYRNQHGNFKTLEDLLLIQTITPDLFQKLTHYLTVDAKP